MTNKERASNIIKLLGGEKNIKLINRCITRIRLHLYDDTKANLEEIKELPGILGAQKKSGEIQIIVGQDVGKVYNEIINSFPNINTGDISQMGEPKEDKSIFSRMLDTLSSILVPSLAPIIGGGMIKGLLFLFAQINLIDPAGGTYFLLNIAGDAMFYFYPFLLAVSAAKKFRTNEYMALTVAGALMYPTLISASAEGGVVYFLGFLPISMINYSSSVIPIILSVWLLSYVYRFFENKLPSIVTIVFTPLLTLLVVLPISLFGIAPIGYYLGDYVARGLEYIINAAPWLAGFVVCATRPFLVITGMHHAARAITTQQIATFGKSSFGAMTFMSTMSQAAAALGVLLIAEKEETKQVALSATIPGFLGITEPALYGIIVKYRAPMIGTILGGGLGGLVSTVLGAHSYAVALPGILSIPVYLGDNPFAFFMGFFVSVAATVIITVVLGKTIYKLDEDEDEKIEIIEGREEISNPVITESLTLSSPASGKIISIKDVDDETFSSEVLGKGIAIEIDEGKIYAPENGIIENVFDTNHAIALTTDKGIEIIIHAGIDTVNLNGMYFDKRCEKGDIIKKGDLILEYNKEALEKEGFETTVIMVISNSNEFLSIIPEKEKGQILKGEKIITLVR